MTRKNNSSGYSGVYWYKSLKKWGSRLSIAERQIHLGYFVEKDDAIAARKNAEVVYAGEILAMREKRSRAASRQFTKYTNDEDRSTALRKSNRVHMKDYRNRKPLLLQLKGVKYRSIRKSIPFELVLEDIPMPSKCKCCGVAIFLNNGGTKSGDSATFDRVIPDKGYVNGNWQWLCHDCNIVKSNCIEAWRFRMVADYLEMHTNRR